MIEFAVPKMPERTIGMIGKVVVFAAGVFIGIKIAQFGKEGIFWDNDFIA